MRFGIGLEVHTKSQGCFLSYWDTRDVKRSDDVLPVLIDEATRDAKSRVEDLIGEEVIGVWPYRLFDADEGSDVEAAPVEGTALETDVTAYTFDRSTEEIAQRFIFPAGVLPTDGEHDFDPDDIAEGYVIERSDAKDRLLRAVVDGRRIFVVWEALVDALPSVDNLEVSWAEPFPGNEAGELWLTKPWQSRVELKSFLKASRSVLFDNGRLELGVYCRNERATLRLTPHKELAFYSESDLHLRTIEAALKAHCIPKAKRLLSLASGFSHVHFAPTPGKKCSHVVEVLEGQESRRIGTFAEDGSLVEQRD